jgi:uridine monophosphate synthetase
MDPFAAAVFGAVGVPAGILLDVLIERFAVPFEDDDGEAEASEPGLGDWQERVNLPPASAERGSLTLGLPEHQGGLVRRLAVVATTAGLFALAFALVVGATQPEALRRVRQIAPELWFLSPGVGVQGGDLAAALQAGLRRDGWGMLLPVSRSLSQAENPRRAAQELLQRMRRQRAAFLESQPAPEQPALSRELAELADGLLYAGCVKFGQFTLKSGLQSPIYLDLRQLVSYPRLLEQSAAAYISLLNNLSFDRLAALPYAALPIGAAVSLLGGWPMIYPRKEAKTYGTRAEIEGIYSTGEQVVVLDDLATTGGSKFEAIQKLSVAGLRVTDVVVLIDRQSGAAESLAEQGYRLHSVFTLTALLDHWEGAQRVDPAHIAAARRFIQETKPG